ncbi:MAG: PKD domain-containing protein [Bacteroidia bacterium]
MKKILALLVAALLGVSQITPLFAQADFVATPSSGCAPLIATFLDLTPNAVSWDWDFGNGNSSSLQSPGLIYNNAGTYTVRMIVTYANGIQDTVIKPNYITVFSSPVADFSVNPNQVCQGDSVQFLDQSILGSGTNLTVSWDFGDGITTSIQNPKHAYQNAGIYSVIYAIIDENACSDLLILPNLIEVDSIPNASFTFDIGFSCTAPVTVSFTADDTLLSLQHFWDFGDGNTSTQTNPQHTYTSFGVFTVLHTLGSATLACTDSFTVQNAVTIGNISPTINLQPSIPCENSPITFSTNAGNNATHDWDFGDGGIASSAQPTHTYSSPGSYTVSVSVIDPNGCMTDSMINISVGQLPMPAFSTVDTFSCSLPFTVNFTDNSQNTVAWLWDFGDGNTSTQANPSHIYTVEGLFDVSLTVFSADSCSRTLIQSALVEVLPPVARILGTPRDGCAPLNVNFAYIPNGANITSWQWSFGDGGTSTLATPSYVYLNPGNYDVQLIVNDASGCTDTLLRTGYIEVGQLPTADFTVDTTIACLDQSLQFTNLASNALTFIWDFGDGGTSFLPNPIYTYTDTGFFDVSLVVENNGCTDTLILTDYIYINPPKVSFLADTTFSCDTPLTVTFTDFSFGANLWQWDFGDGSIDSIPSPVHTFTQSGAFLVSLVVTDTLTGCSDQQNMQISIEPMVAEFAYSDTTGCAPFPIFFNNTSSNFTSQYINIVGATIYTGQTSGPTLTVLNPGVYDVFMAATNALGCTDTISKPGLLTVNGPVVDIIASPDSGCNPLPVQFGSSTVTTTPVTSLTWYFGDGNTSNQANPLHTYTTPGSFPVSISVTDMDGCTDSTQLNNAILVSEPTADFVSPSPIDCPGVPISFNNLSAGINLSYAWDFGDGGTSNQSNPSHVYANNGVYTIALTVTDVNGCMHTETKLNYVTIADLVAGFTADTTSASCPPLLVNFTSSSSLNGNNTYQWDFGDGTTSTQLNPSHIYAIPGTFDVSLIITTGSGCADTVLAPSLIDLAGPYGTFSFSPDSGCPSLDVFVDVDPTNTVLYQYDMGDGTLTNSADSNYVHTYTLPGTYFPQINLNDGLGCDVLITSATPVVVFPLPTAAFTVSQNIVCDSGTVLFFDMSSASAGITSWLWDFGDGSSSATANPIHTYNQSGSFDVSLVVFSDDGCSDTLLMPNLIQVVSSPLADIAVLDSVGCQIFTLDLLDNSTPTNSPLIDWQWDFGDASPLGVGNTVTHSYGTVGTYMSSLVITDSLGCSDTAYQSIEVLPLPNPDFIVLPDSFGCAPFIGQFQDITVGAVDWQWDFGDGSAPQFASSPSHLYQNDGIYSVSLIVTDINSCVDSITKINYINLAHPVADFDFNTPVCPQEVVTLTDQSISDTSLVYWEWDYGDGQGGIGNPAFHTYNASGFYDVELIVADFFGCRDTVSIQDAIEVLINEVPLPPAVNFVSVVNNNAINISWEPYQSTLNDFGEYVIHRQENGGGYQEVFSTTNINQLQYNDIGIDTRSNQYCYRLQVRNYCGLGSELGASVEHCAVNLSSMSLPEQIELNWTPYEGWPNGVEEYQVYRVLDYSTTNAVLLNTVPGNVLTYLDAEMNCEEAFSYRIEAIARNTAFTSWSDTSRNRPIHARIQDEAHILRASVQDNLNILLEWELPAVPGLVEYLIEKNDGSGFQSLANGPIATSTFSYVDAMVDVSVQPYDYRAFAIDTCGDLTPVGRLGRTILLKANYSNGRVQLDWSGYEQWEQGVEKYQIEVYNESTGQFSLQAEVGGGNLNYLDEDADIGQPINCYRITAIELGGNLAISHSNEVCVTLDPLIFAPSAFTPNNDGKNDRFVLKGTFVDEFRMDIYNRWGQLIFTTLDINEGWDGSMRDGSMAPEGVYVFVATGNGYSGLGNRRSGTVTLMR